MSSQDGAGTRIPRHLLKTGSMTLLWFLQHSINLHPRAYFSIVLLSAACACFPC